MTVEDYEPQMPADRVRRLRRWHEDASAALRALGDHEVEHLGLTLRVPAGVFPPAPMSRLLGRAVLADVCDGDRVLDMGTGSGVNAVLAARRGARVTALDVNPDAIAAAADNAERCGVADRIDVRVGDLFDGVTGRFDVVVFDPPFRWFPPADMLERAITDDGYRTLERFLARVGDHLSTGGRVLTFFGTTGDIDHFHALAQRHRLGVEVLDTCELARDAAVETYWSFRLRPDRDGPVLGHRPQASEPVPELVEQVAAGDRIEVVWRNQAGGLTFAVGRGSAHRFVKWAPTAASLDLSAEAERLRWVRQRTPVPRVLELRTDGGATVLVTSPVPGRSAVSPRWLAAPDVAVRALGTGLRALHERLPIDDCPFTWSAEDRLRSARRRIERGAPDRTSWHAEHQHPSLGEALERLADPPPIDRLVVCHGDACAPNTLLDDDGSWSGHVDLGASGVADRWADLAVATWSTRWNHGPGWEPLLLESYGVEEDPDRSSYYRLLWDLEA